MEKNDFKEFKPMYIENCKMIVEQDGDCCEENYVDCDNCPFVLDNSFNDKNCGHQYGGDNQERYNSAKEYLSLYKEEKMEKDLSFEEAYKEMIYNGKKVKPANWVKSYYEFKNGKIVNEYGEDCHINAETLERKWHIWEEPAPEKMIPVAELQKLIKQYVE